MSFEQYQYKSGVLGQGCYISGYATRPGVLRCRLPIMLALSLLDLGHWQLISILEDIYQSPTLQKASWRVENLLEHINNERSRISEDREQTRALMPLNSLADFYWRADTDCREQAIMRLRDYPEDLLKKRLARILAHQPDQITQSEGTS